MWLVEGQHRSEQKGIRWMRLSHGSPALSATFDDPNLVSVSGLAPVVALAQSCRLGDLVKHNAQVPRSWIGVAGTPPPKPTPPPSEGRSQSGVLRGARARACVRVRWPVSALRTAVAGSGAGDGFPVGSQCGNFQRGGTGAVPE